MGSWASASLATSPPLRLSMAGVCSRPFIVAASTHVPSTPGAPAGVGVRLLHPSCTALLPPATPTHSQTTGLWPAPSLQPHGTWPTPPPLLLGAGWNAYGQLGTGNTVNYASPGAVRGGQTFVAIAAGVSTACGLQANGSAWCWGEQTHAGYSGLWAFVGPRSTGSVQWSSGGLAGWHAACAVPVGGGACLVMLSAPTPNCFPPCYPSPGCRRQRQRRGGCRQLLPAASTNSSAWRAGLPVHHHGR